MLAGNCNAVSQSGPQFSTPGWVSVRSGSEAVVTALVFDSAGQAVPDAGRAARWRDFVMQKGAAAYTDQDMWEAVTVLCEYTDRVWEMHELAVPGSAAANHIGLLIRSINIACTVLQSYIEYGLYILWPHMLAQELLDVAADVLEKPALSIAELEHGGGSADLSGRVAGSGWGEININMRIPLPEDAAASDGTAGRLYERWNQHTEEEQYEDTLRIALAEHCIYLTLRRLCQFGELPWFAEAE